MGTKYFHSPTKNATFQPSGLNLEARAGGAGGFASRSAGAGVQKDIGAAQGLYKAAKLKASSKTAASNAPGPKKV